MNQRIATLPDDPAAAVAAPKENEAALRLLGNASLPEAGRPFIWEISDFRSLFAKRETVCGNLGGRFREVHMRNIFRRRGRSPNVIWIIVLVSSMGFLLHTAWAQQTKVPSDLPFPSEIKIIPPDPTVPKEIAVFSGVWVGKWENGRNSALIVKEINGNAAEVIYLWGKNMTLATPGASGSVESQGTISNGQLKARLLRQTDTYFKLNDDGTLSGTWEGSRGTRMRGQFSRIQYP